MEKVKTQIIDQKVSKEDARDVRVAFLMSKNMRRELQIAAAQNYSTMTIFSLAAVQEKIERQQAEMKSKNV